MALVLTEEQVMIRDSAAGFLAEKASVAQLRVLRDSANEQGYDKNVWQEMVDMGWAGIAVSEEFGGLGFGYVGLGLVLEQMGRHLSVSPLQSSILLGASLVGELGNQQQKEALLPAIAAGGKLVTLALQEGAHHAPEQTALSALCEGASYGLCGSKNLVLDAHVADSFIVIARTGGEAGEEQGLSAFVVDADTPGVSVTRSIMVDSRNAGVVTFDNVSVPAENLMGEEGQAWAGLTRALDIANIGLAAELLGISVEAFERTVEYLKERKQFGRVIGSFQGLQHRAAELFAELELARSLVLQALQAIDEQAEDLSVHASAVKAKLCEVAQRATNEGIQMHGGIGMTDEHEIGFYIKRARAAQHLFGDYNYHLDRYAALSGF